MTAEFGPEAAASLGVALKPNWAPEVRAQLDSLGATSTRIVVTSDLDEYAIAALAAAPVDGYGVGTQLVTGSGHPTCGFVYKLVAREDDDGVMTPVAKKSPEKISVGGRKWAWRRTADGVATHEVIGIGDAPVGETEGRSLLVPLLRGGEIVGAESLDQARARHLSALAELPVEAQSLSKGEQVLKTVHV